MSSPHPQALPVRALAIALVLAATAAPSSWARNAAAPITPVPRTGAPSDGRCNDALCHTSFPLNDSASGIQWRLLDQGTAADFTEYTPGQAYTIALAFSSSAANRLKFGFQMTVLTATATQWTPAPFGTTGADPRWQRQTPTVSGAPRQYVTHTSNGTAPVPLPPPLGGNGGAWAVPFNAPAAGTGTVTFYFCLNAANGNTRLDGDYIWCDTVNVTEGVVGPTDTDGDGLDDATERGLGTDPANPDSDGDLVRDGEEVIAGADGFITNPLDEDSDDDGLSDSAELLPANGSDPTACDSDGDTLPDGLEAGVDAALADTDLGARCFVADADPATRTSPTSPNTDGDGDSTNPCTDGAEDANGNGKVDPGETDPNADDCPAVVPTTIGLRQDARVTALTGGAGTCGPATNLPLATIFQTTCANPPSACVINSWSIPGPPAAQLDDALSEWVRAGEADAAFEAGVLVFYELETCDVVLGVAKRGADLVLQRR